VFDTTAALPAQAPSATVGFAQPKPQVQAPVPAVAQAPAKPEIAAISAKARVREAFAQLPQEQHAFEPKMSDMATAVVPEPKMYPARQPLKHKVAAKPRTARPMIIVAQQPRWLDSW